MTLKTHQLNNCVSTTGLPTISSVVSDNNIPLSNNDLPAIWKDFLWGMHNLQKYICRTNEDPYKVARSNLKLLHSSLRATPIYKENIQQKKKQYVMGANSHKWIPLVNTPAIKGGIILLTKEHAQEINFRAADYLTFNNFGTKQANIDNVSDHHYQLLLVIQGKIQVTPVSLTNTFENMPHAQLTSVAKLNKGDTHLEYIGPNNGINIESVTPNSLILSVKLLNYSITNSSNSNQKTVSRAF